MDPFLPVDRVNEILHSARRLRVGVFGDFTLGGIWNADGPGEERPSARSIIRERYFCAGGAASARTLAALGVSAARSFTVLGEDWRGDLLRRMLNAAGVDTGNTITVPGWSTPFSGSVTLAVDDRQLEESQLEFVNTVELPLDVEEDLLTRLENSLPELDALVVVDAPASGVITPGLLEGLTRLSGQGEPAVITARSRERIGQFDGMVRVLDRVEAVRWLFPGREAGQVGLDAFVEAALYPQVDCGCPLFITLGEQGSLVLAGGESHLAPAVAGLPGPVGEEILLAALAAGLAAGALPVEAAAFGSLVAAAAARRGDVAGPEEVLALAANLTAG